jgi:Peptidase M50B-like
MKRQHQAMLILSTLALCWLAMQAVHELGHVLGGVLSGGRIKAVVLQPLEISRTDLSDNPHPLFVAWIGPLVGVALPGLAAAVAKWRETRWTYLAQFFAGFCLIANGAYLGVGSFQGVGDAGDLMRLGTPNWVLWSFGLVAVAAGLWSWNGLGSAYGLGKARGQVDRTAAYLVFVLLVVTIALELAFAW